MTVGLQVSRLISVSVTISPGGAAFANFNSLLIMGNSNVINVTDRIRGYNSLLEVAGDFLTTSGEYKAATLYFGQSPTPTQLYIGRWAKTATAGLLVCGAQTVAQQAIALWNAIVAGTFLVTIDGQPWNVTGLSFAASANLNAVATAIQTVIAGHFAGATVVWNQLYNQFTIASGTTGATSSVGALGTSTAVGKAVFIGQPTPANTLTVNGTVVTFVAGAPGAFQVQIGGSTAATLANLLAFLSASADVNIAKMTYSVVGTTLYLVSVATGVAGNGYTLTTNDGNITPTAPAGGSASPDISATLLGTVATLEEIVAGIGAESALAAVQVLDGLSTQWYGLNFAAGATNQDIADADHLAVAGYIEGDGTNNPHLYLLTTSEATALNPNSAADIGSQLKALGYNRTGYQYSSTNPFASVSMFGRALTANLSGSNTAYTLAYKQEPGVTPESLSANSANALDAKRYNYYANFNNGQAIIVNGIMASGVFFDTMHEIDFMANQIQTDVFNLLETTPTKIPQTDAGNHLIATTIENACAVSVNNGTLAPGTWNSQGFGQYSQGDFLPKGYYVYQPPISTQAESDRALRKSVAFQVMAKLAGAVQDVAIGVFVNQ